MRLRFTFRDLRAHSGRLGLGGSFFHWDIDGKATSIAIYIYIYTSTTTTTTTATTTMLLLLLLHYYHSTRCCGSVTEPSNSTYQLTNCQQQIGSQSDW